MLMAEHCRDAPHPPVVERREGHLRTLQSRENGRARAGSWIAAAKQTKRLLTSGTRQRTRLSQVSLTRGLLP